MNVIITEVDDLVRKMKIVLNEMHLAIIERNYDRFEMFDKQFCKIWDYEVKTEMFLNKADEKRLYDCNIKFFQLRKAW